MEIKKLILGRIRNNTYILSKGKECIVIDPSMEYIMIHDYIKENDLKIVAVLITHAHFDHVYSLDNLIEDFGRMPIYMHEDDLGLYKASVEKMRKPLYDVDYKLKGGETLEILGEKIEVLHFPGHAQGCVGYIIGDGIFIGDFIFKGSIGRTDLPTSDPKKMQESLKRFAKLDRDLIIYSGHGEDSTYFEELKTNPYLAGLGND